MFFPFKPLVFLTTILLIGLTPDVAQFCSAEERVAWTASRVHGSPEAPLPLSIVPAFPKIQFNDPMHVRWQPHAQRYFVCELGAKLWSFPHDEEIERADLVADFKADLKSYDTDRFHGCKEVYSIIFDPNFADNRYIYVCLIFANKHGKPEPDGTRISRFRLTNDNPPRVELQSELPIISWIDGGHNGCDLAFDQSGCLLISTGDATDPSPPDRLRTGQDCSDLLSSVLRVDVRNATREKPYEIPADNPFRGVPHVREEIWAFGFRNPWRMTVDPVSGRVYLGDVGWEKWELVQHVVRGGNYGWSVREGHELIQPNETIGPSPILPPRVAISHAEAASMTGGFVYRGKLLPEIAGQYLFGDWISGRVWAMPIDETSPHREVASGQLRIIAFSPDRDGEPLVLNHLNKTSLFRLVKNQRYVEELKLSRDFPKKLSQTGLFASTKDEKPAPGVRPFSINHPMWQDGAQATHYLALPDLAHVTVYDSPQAVGSVAMFNSRLHYPVDTVLAKTLTYGNRKIETQLLHYDGRLWRGYSYIWNTDQSDAELAPSEGSEIRIEGSSPRQWRVHSRNECMQCHNPWPENTLAFTPEQLHQPDQAEKSPWLALVREGYVKTLNGNREPIAPENCVTKPLALSSRQSEVASGEWTEKETLNHQARSYLHVNCAHCHQFGAGAAVDLSLKINDEAKAMKAMDIAPSKGRFGLPNAALIASGYPTRSTLLFRMSSASTGRMPHIGSREVDHQAVALIARWIRSLGDNASSQSETLETILSSLEKQLTSSKATIDPDLIGSLIEQAFGASLQLSSSWMSESSRRSIPMVSVERLAKSDDPLVSSLYEAFVPVDERQRKLGSHATYADVADRKGDVTKGETWFFDVNRSQCSKCHKIGERGAEIGPDLTRIGQRLTPAQLFEALHDPSRIIDPKYQTHLIQLLDGTSLTGVVLSEDKESLTLVTSKGDKVVLAISEIENRKLSRESVMPSGITNEMTAQQLADLLAYLESLK